MKYYDNIDEIEAYRFYKAKENQGALVRGSNMFNPEPVNEDLSFILEDLNYQLIDRFGIDRKYKKILELRKLILELSHKIQSLEIEELKGENRKPELHRVKNQLKGKLERLDKLMQGGEKFDFIKEVKILENILETKIDFKTVTLSEFYILNNLANEQFVKH